MKEDFRGRRKSRSEEELAHSVSFSTQYQYVSQAELRRTINVLHQLYAVSKTRTPAVGLGFQVSNFGLVLRNADTEAQA